MLSRLLRVVYLNVVNFTCVFRNEFSFMVMLLNTLFLLKVIVRDEYEFQEKNQSNCSFL